MNKKYLLIIAVTIFIMVIFYWQDNYFGRGNMQPSFGSYRESVAPVTESVPQDNFTNEVTPSAEAVIGADAEASTTENVLFSNVLNEISQCLQVKNTTDQAAQDPTLSNLLASLQPALGEATVYTDDWAQTDVRYGDGVTKRIRTEINYDNPGNPVRYLQIYKLNEEGIPELEEMDPQYSINPTDEYIASLMVGSDVMLSEKGGRAYFQGGEEMSIIEQNGKLDSFTLTKGNKTLNCISLATGASTCQCY